MRVESPSPPGHDCGVYDTITQEDEGWLTSCSPACSPLGSAPSPSISTAETPGGSIAWSSGSSSPRGDGPHQLVPRRRDHARLSLLLLLPRRTRAQGPGHRIEPLGPDDPTNPHRRAARPGPG